MSNLIQRSLTGILFLAIVIGAILWNFYSVLFLFAGVALLAYHEYHALARKLGYSPQYYLVLITAAFFFVSIWLIKYYQADVAILTLIFPWLVAIPIAEMYRKKKRPMANMAISLFGFLYTVVPFGLVIAMSQTDSGNYSGKLILAFFILIWTSDTLAYVWGMLLGRHKLFERISPKKTWEGWIGGAIFTMTAGYLMGSMHFVPGGNHWIVIGLIVAIAGVYGDLAESLIKRHAEVKDSGQILPGHGGILDRFDAVLLAAPLVFAYLQMFNIS